MSLLLLNGARAEPGDRARRSTAHESGWSDLASASGSFPTQDVPWAVAGLDAFGGAAEIVVCGDPDAPDAIAASALTGGRLELVGSGPTGEPADLLSRSPAALGELTERLAAVGRPILLHRVPAESPTIASLRQAIGRRGLVRVGAVGGHPAVDLSADWREPGGGLSSSRRSALRRARRRAEQAGEVATELLAPEPHEVQELLDEAFAVEARSWKGAAGTALLQTPALASFFRRYAAEAATRGALRLEFLRIAGRSVAMQLGVEWRRRIWLLKIGYDEAHAAASPGQLLLAESIADAARRELDGYELLGTAAKWTEPWAPLVHPCARVIAYPATRHGFVSLAGVAGGQLRAQARRRASSLSQGGQRIAAARYVAGPDLDSALREEARCAAAGYATTIGYWDKGAADRAEVTADCFAAVEALARGSQLSVKYASMKQDRAVLDELLERCVARGVSLHFDALAPDTAEPALREAARLATAAPAAVSCTLPARWRRSVTDAPVVGAEGLGVRVVKGEWADPDAPDRDARDGFAEVVDALAGAARHVAVATQDAPLAAAALERLIAAGTPCELQVLYAMRSRAAVRAARRLKVPVRVYVPYGRGRIPYSVERDPRTLARLAFDLLPGVSYAPPGTRTARRSQASARRPAACAAPARRA
jgi:hypothetical protein